MLTKVTTRTTVYYVSDKRYEATTVQTGATLDIYIEGERIGTATVTLQGFYCQSYTFPNMLETMQHILEPQVEVC